MKYDLLLRFNAESASRLQTVKRSRKWTACSADLLCERQIPGAAFDDEGQCGARAGMRVSIPVLGPGWTGVDV